ARAAPLTIARKRAGQAGLYLLASGRAGRLDVGEALSKEEWIVVADAAGAAQATRILAAAPIKEEEALALGGVATEESASFDPESRTVRARRIRRLGAITLSETPLPAPSGEAARAAILEAVARSGLSLLAAGGAARKFLARLALARRFDPSLPAIDEQDATARADIWLGPLLGDPPSIDRPNADDIARGLAGLLDWEEARRVDALLPTAWEAPTGRKLAIDYEAEGGPRIEARVQEFYGLSDHPAIARGALPLAVSLLSPAHRQVALTKDLPGFWRSGYRDMAKDMRGQYPKHDWPDDPAAARPHVGKTKARLRDER
ncbi:MAG: hypothetical protein K2Q06_01725, partial [Parvularculaceae bacterium]|nr:hypothetical protein [Parvularculaceae bacterium]